MYAVTYNRIQNCIVLQSGEYKGVHQLFIASKKSVEPRANFGVSVFIFVTAVMSRLFMPIKILDRMYFISKRPHHYVAYRHQSMPWVPFRSMHAAHLNETIPLCYFKQKEEAVEVLNHNQIWTRKKAVKPQQQRLILCYSPKLFI